MLYFERQLLYYLVLLLQVITTERAGHARDVMSIATKDDLNALDGVIAVVRPLYKHQFLAPTTNLPISNRTFLYVMCRAEMVFSTKW